MINPVHIYYKGINKTKKAKFREIVSMGKLWHILDYDMHNILFLLRLFLLEIYYIVAPSQRYMHCFGGFEQDMLAINKRLILLYICDPIQ